MKNKLETDTVFCTSVCSAIKQKGFDPGIAEFILVTGHRRENFGQGFIDICTALKTIALARPHLNIVYPVHLNPNVRKPVNDLLAEVSNIYLIEPLEYEAFLYLMSLAKLIITTAAFADNIEQLSGLNGQVEVFENRFFIEFKVNVAEGDHSSG